MMKSLKSVPTEPRRTLLIDAVWLLLLAIVLVIPVFPGRMNADALDMYGQALQNRYHDWHPALVPWLWYRLGVSSLLLGLQTTLTLWLTLCAARIGAAVMGLRRRYALSAAVILVLFPPVLGYLLVVSKDTWTGVLLFMAMISALAPQRNHIGWRIFRLLSYGAATYLRMELLALSPLLIALEWLIGHPQLSWRKAVGLLPMLWLAFFAFKGAERLLPHPERTFPAQQIFILDLAGFSVETGQMLLPPEAFPPQNIDILRKHYWPVSIIPFMWGQPASEMAQKVSPSQGRALFKTWLRQIIHAPALYWKLRHKMAVAYLKGHWGFHPDIDDNPFLQLAHPTLNTALNDYYLAPTPRLLYSHYLPVLGSLLLALWLWRNKTTVSHIAAGFCGFAFLYQIGFIFVATAPDFRYGYASVLIFYFFCLTTLLQYITKRFQRKPLYHN